MNSHRMRWDALIFAVAFAVVIGVWAALAYGDVTVDQLLVAGPVALIVVGVAGIALTLRRSS